MNTTGKSRGRIYLKKLEHILDRKRISKMTGVLGHIKRSITLANSLTKIVTRMTSSSGSTYDGQMITNDYLKGNYFQRYLLVLLS